MAKKILVVDDESDILVMLEARLKKEGYEVAVASAGEEALLKVKENPPGLVILDVMMPKPNGLEVCRTLKDDPKYKDIPIILLTAKTAPDDRFWGGEAGADAYLTKPYDPKELLDKVRELIR